MTILEATQLITAISAAIAAIAGVIALFKIQTVHKTTNSKMDLLLQTTREAALAKGRKDAEDEAVSRATSGHE